MTEREAKKLAERVLSFSKLPECSVSITEFESAFVRFANNGITTSGITRNRTIVISSTRDRKTGDAQTSETDDASLEAAVRSSEELAGLSLPNPEHMPPLGAQKYPEPPAFDEETAGARQPQMLPHVRSAIDHAVSKKLVAAGFFERQRTWSAVANKAGLFGYWPSADARMSTTVRPADGSSSGWAGQPSAHIAQINGAALAASAAGKCERWRKPERLEPDKFTVVLEPTAVCDLVRLLAQSFDARATEEGRTFLSKRGGGDLVGEKLFPEFITLRSDPFGGRLPSPPWTNGLLPNQAVPWIDKGVVRNLAYSRYWASKKGREPVPFPSSLVLEGSETPIEELIKSTERGLLVTHFWYIRNVNPRTLQFTGLTRDGLFLIENGRIAKPVMNLRFNESPVRLLQNAVKLGQPMRVRGLEGPSMMAPAMLAREFTFTSVSDAI